MKTLFNLRPYQEDLIDKINNSSSMRNCVQLPTGGGKTVIFSHLANNFKGNVLILVNRIELLEQTIKNINRPLGFITANKTEIKEVTIGMVESVYNRINKGKFSLDDIDLIIVDEVQNLQFIKVFENYTKRLLGFTDTPVIMKKETYYKCRYCEQKTEKAVTCCGKETKKHNKNVSLNQWYGELIIGIEIKELINMGFLTLDHNFSCDNALLNNLKTDESGNYTASSENDVFNNLAGLNNLLENYKTHCIGKKTMVFNTNIEANNSAIEAFILNGYNVRGFDSKSSESRKEVVDWFRNTPDGVLMSVGVFTTGFDVEDVECIIMNKATTSLSLYHQIVGRGGRITDKIYKPFFKVIDLGGNISRFGCWSDKVDWFEIYNNTKEKLIKVSDLEDFINCAGCGAMIKSYPCEYCGEKIRSKKSNSVIKIATEVKKLQPPKAEHILNYSIKNNLDINEAKTLTANYILDMFIFARTEKDSIIKNIDYLKQKIKEYITPIYFALHKSELEGNRIRTLNNFLQKIYKKLNRHYDK